MSILNSSDLRVKSIIETIRYGFTVFTVHSLFSWISIVVCILNPNYELMMDVREGTHQFEIPISMSLLFDTNIEWVHTFHLSLFQRTFNLNCLIAGKNFLWEKKKPVFGVFREIIFSYFLRDLRLQINWKMAICLKPPKCASKMSTFASGVPKFRIHFNIDSH